ncbi:MAG: Stk1 family PASTA domain-containing Ser/Thr kinase [Actinobacteria bacterium]|nr:Stk1 family PASTA domain-containing Ser/Thr kinase [Actinomycetota bacterium]
MVDPQVYANRYEVVREIARGGMAEVLLARDTKLDRPVALKVLSAELSRDPAFVERFRLEAQAAANLNHPNIVSVYDWGQEHGTSFIVMEYVEGSTVRDLIRAQERVAPAQAADIGGEIAAALSFAHKAGVVHRDVKPGNVLLTPGGQVKVTDFGIARAEGGSEGLTRTGAVMGTATYFSPEQAQGLPVDGRSDVYSLGVVLYEMLTGTPPFTGDNPVSVAYKHVREPVPSLTGSVPAIPAQLERVVTTCLQKDPLGRYQSADDLREDLLRFRGGQAVIGGAMTAQVAAVGDATRTSALPMMSAAGAATAPSKKPRRGPLVAVIALLAVLVAVIGFLVVSQLGGGDGGGTVVVTDVVGKEEAVAIATLEKQGLEVDVIHKANDTVAEGFVVRQDPSAGVKVADGETIELVVSSGVGKVKLPDLENDLYEDAARTLIDAGLVPVPTENASDEIDMGRVIRTDPPAGTRVAKGANVTVVVSVGPAPVTVPNVVGQDEFDATQNLARVGFVVQKTTAASSTVASGIVISTIPAGNQSAPNGATVRIVVSTGPELVNVPNVVGQFQGPASNTLTNAGFDVTVVQVPSTEANNGRVISQNPAGGTSAGRGSTVTITVGTGTGTTTTTT